MYVDFTDGCGVVCIDPRDMRYVLERLILDVDRGIVEDFTFFINPELSKLKVLNL